MKDIIKKNVDLINKQAEDTESSESERIVSFYLFIFDKPDLVGDVISKDTEIIKYNHLKYFLNHDLTKLIGVVLSIDKDEKGVYATVKIAKTPLGDEVYELYKMGAITQHSVGMLIHDTEELGDGTWHIKKLELFEVSTLTHFAAQPDATTIEVKNNENIYSIYNNNMENKKIVKKATPEEMQELTSYNEEIANKMVSLEQNVSEVNTTVANLTALVNQMNEKYNSSKQPNEPSAEEENKEKVVKSALTVVESGMNKQINVSHLLKRKSINILGTSTALESGNLFNSIGHKRNLMEVFNIIPINGYNITWSGISTHTLAPGNNTPGCYTPNISNITIQHVNANLSRVVAVTDFCKDYITQFVNQEDFYNKIFELLYGEAQIKVANSAYNALVTNGTVNTATPSWTALAGAVTDTTIVDLLHIHSEDINSLSGGKINPMDCVIVLNPIDYSRMMTDKTPSNRDIVTNPAISQRFFSDLSVTPGNYVVLPYKYLDLFVNDKAVLKRSTPSGLDAFSGTEYLGVEIHHYLTITSTVNNNVVIYGSIAAAIANY